MAETVKVPGIGQTKKIYVYAGVAAVGVFGIMWWRSRQSGSSAATSSASSAPASTDLTGSTGDPYPPDGTTGNPSDPYSTDPSTGMTYGDEQAGYGGYGSPYDTGYYDASTAGGGSTGPSGPGGFTSNAQWSQYAEQYLIQTLGMGSATVGNALGKYITGQPVTADQEQIINDAVSVAGYPPVSGPGNYPPSIRVSGSKTGGKTYAENPVAGLKVSNPGGKTTGTIATVTWHESNHASSYKVTLKENGRIVHTASTSALQYRFTGLKLGSSYTATVLANPAKNDAKPASITIKTW